MKKLLVFFIAIISINMFVGNNFSCVNNFVYATENINVCYGNNVYTLDLNSNNNISMLRKNINGLDKETHFKIINKIMDMGFGLKDALCYVYPNLEQSINNICDSLLILPEEPTVYADNNNCKIIFKNAKNGVKVDKNALFKDFYENLKSNANININLQSVGTNKTLEDLQKLFVLVSKFETSFETSSESRKNNIMLACQAINGQFIRSGKTFSFNTATGARTEENGYKEAKIIKDGSYVDGFGGGVCQVSTTLYNACILAGLTATEVHNHTLPAGYIKPCFDAMVSMGSSDLKIKNNTPNDYIITCSTQNNKCTICLYGVKPEYQIQTRYEKYEIIPAEEDIVETDASKYVGDYGEGEHRISYGAEGYKAKGYLDYYKDGVLIKSELIRDNTYKPKKGVILFVERAETE